MVDLNRENTKEFLSKPVVITTRLNGSKYAGVFHHYSKERCSLTNFTPLLPSGSAVITPEPKRRRDFLFTSIIDISFDEDQN